MKNRQGLTIATLIIAIVGLSIGFAAFSENPLTNGVRIHNNQSNVTIVEDVFPSGTQIIFDDKTILFNEVQ